MKVKIGSKYTNKNAKAVLAFVMNDNGEVEIVESGENNEDRDNNGIELRSYALCETVNYMRDGGLSTAEVLLALCAAV